MQVPFSESWRVSLTRYTPFRMGFNTSGTTSFVQKHLPECETFLCLPFTCGVGRLDAYIDLLYLPFYYAKSD